MFMKKIRVTIIAAFAAVILAIVPLSFSQIARFEGNDIILENNYIQVTFTESKGFISSWIIKATGQELAYFYDEGSKGLLSLRIWTGNWDTEGGWPTEVGRAFWTNEILANSYSSALIRQGLLLTEDGTAKGMKVLKYFLLQQNSYQLYARYSLVNKTNHTIAFTALTIESTANLGSGGRLGWLEHDSRNINIIDQGQSIDADFQGMALETETGDALFANLFLDYRPTFGWLFEFCGENGRDMEPHFGPINLASGDEESFQMIVYGGPGSLDRFNSLALFKSLDWSSLEATNTPQSFALNPNYPNPFNPTTTIQYQLPVDATVEILIYNMEGQKIRSLVNEFASVGVHSVEWNGRDDFGKEVASGVYLYRMKAADYVMTRKLTLIR